MESGFLRAEQKIDELDYWYVSILVLMESGFLQKKPAAKGKSKPGFYPCFNGIRVLTIL